MKNLLNPVICGIKAERRKDGESKIFFDGDGKSIVALIVTMIFLIADRSGVTPEKFVGDLTDIVKRSASEYEAAKIREVKIPDTGLN